jgi:hypothetical protein
MESMPPTRRAKINGAKQTSAVRFTLGLEKISTEGDYDKPRRVPENLSWVHLGFEVTLASRDASEKVDVTG